MRISYRDTHLEVLDCDCPCAYHQVHPGPFRGLGVESLQSQGGGARIFYEKIQGLVIRDAWRLFLMLMCISNYSNSFSIGDVLLKATMKKN